MVKVTVSGSSPLHSCLLCLPLCPPEDPYIPLQSHKGEWVLL